MTAHRYWRLDIFNLYGGVTVAAAAEIELRTSIGGSDVTGSGTASASASEGGYPVSNAFDNNDSTHWAQPVNSQPAWIKYDFGLGNSYDIAEILYRAHPSDGAYSPRNIALMYSDDDSNWSVKYVWLGLTGWGAGEARVLNTSSGTYTGLNDGSARRYWKVIFHSSGENYSSCAELEMRITTGGADQTGSGTPSAFAEYGGYEVGKAFDNNASTLWASYPSPNNPHGERWIKYDFGNGVTKSIMELSWQARADGYVGDNPWAIIVLCSDDDSTWYVAWVDLDTDRWTAWSTSETRVFTAPSTASASLSPSASPSLSPSASISPSSSPSLSPSASESPSQSPSISPSISISPSTSPSTSPSISPSASISVSPSLSPSISPSLSPSQSPSLSPSQSPSESPSASLSPSLSLSLSPSTSPSGSPSASPSTSVSPSVSPSLSPSASLSPSESPSLSPSLSLSLSPSLSPSVSPSAEDLSSTGFLIYYDGTTQYFWQATGVDLF